MRYCPYPTGSFGLRLFLFLEALLLPFRWETKPLEKW